MGDHIQNALEIVKAQAGFRAMSVDEMCSMVSALSQAIQQVMAEESAATEPSSSAASKQINERNITCLECGKSFKLLTRRHLLSHGLSPEEYKEKWGYPKDTSLVCKNLQRERRKKMKDMKLWEKRSKNAAK